MTIRDSLSSFGSVTRRQVSCSLEMALMLPSRDFRVQDPAVESSTRTRERGRPHSLAALVATSTNSVPQMMSFEVPMLTVRASSGTVECGDAAE